MQSDRALVCPGKGEVQIQIGIVNENHFVLDQKIWLNQNIVVCAKSCEPMAEWCSLYNCHCIRFSSQLFFDSVTR